MSTGDALLIEGNAWDDQVWGRCTCRKHAAIPGLNHLGRELMALRGRLRGDVDRWHRVAVTGHRDLNADQADWVQGELPRVLRHPPRHRDRRVIADARLVSARDGAAAGRNRDATG